MYKTPQQKCSVHTFKKRRDGGRKIGLVLTVTEFVNCVPNELCFIFSNRKKTKAQAKVEAAHFAKNIISSSLNGFPFFLATTKKQRIFFSRFFLFFGYIEFDNIVFFLLFHRIFLFFYSTTNRKQKKKSPKHPPNCSTITIAHLFFFPSKKKNRTRGRKKKESLNELLIIPPDRFFFHFKKPKTRWSQWHPLPPQNKKKKKDEGETNCLKNEQNGCCFFCLGRYNCLVGFVIFSLLLCFLFIYFYLLKLIKRQRFFFGSTCRMFEAVALIIRSFLSLAFKSFSFSRHLFSSSLVCLFVSHC